MAKTANDAPAGPKMVAADCVSVILVALGCSVSKAQLDMMSALDGTRTSSSFEHQFRSIVAKAKELKARVDSGEVFIPVPPAKKRGETASPAASQKRKLVPTTAKGKPAKKRQVTAKPSDTEAATPLSDSDNLTDEASPEGKEDFIKNEPDWEHDFA